jgi:hypothetical protein
MFRGWSRTVVVQLVLGAALVIGVVPVVFYTAFGGDTATTSGGVIPAGVADHGMGMQADMSTAADKPYYGISRTPKLIVQVDLVPARVGTNTMVLTALGQGDALQQVQKWTATASLRSGDSPSVPVDVIPMSQGVARAVPQLPVAGDWVFSITVSTPDNARTTISQTVKIS